MPPQSQVIKVIFDGGCAATEALAIMVLNWDRVTPGQCRQTVGVIIVRAGALATDRTARNPAPITVAAANRHVSKRLRIKASGMALLRLMADRRRRQ